jgi:DNA-binding XRE family transcriptional regulator
MGDIQKLTIDGKGYVLLSEEDYEDLVDTLEAQIVLARIAAGEETWPLEIVEARANGENAITVFRKYRGLSVSDLAAAAGISQPYLSEIEGGKKTGSVDVLKRIATVLKVDLDDLVVEREAHQYGASTLPIAT